MHRHLVERACHTRHRSPIRAESDPCWFVVVLCVDARWTGRCSRSNGVSAIDCWLCWLCCGRQNENPETAPAWTPSRPAPRRTHSACPRNGTAQHKTSERTNERITEGHRCRQGPRAAASHRTVPVWRWERMLVPSLHPRSPRQAATRETHRCSSSGNGPAWHRTRTHGRTLSTIHGCEGIRMHAFHRCVWHGPRTRIPRSFSEGGAPEETPRTPREVAAAAA